MEYKVVHPQAETKVIVTHDGKEIIFMINTLINRRLKNDQLEETYIILNGYLNTKPKVFHDKLFNALIASKEYIIEHIGDRVDDIAHPVIHGILDVFDYEDVHKYILTLEDKGILKATKGFPAEYDSSIHEDGKGSRVQTYLQSDYLELLAMSTMMKATFPALGEFAYSKHGIIAASPHKEQLLIYPYMTHSLVETPPFVKINQSIGKLVDRLFQDLDNSAVRVIEKSISREYMPMLTIGSIVLDKLFPSGETTDNIARNLVTVMYSYAASKLKLRDKASSIKLKRLNTASEESDSIDSEAVLEAYRVSTSGITLGGIEEYTYHFKPMSELGQTVLDKAMTLCHFMSVDVTEKDLSNVIDTFQIFKQHPPTKESVMLISWMYSNVIDPRAFPYFHIDEIIMAMAVGFLKLLSWNMGEIAKVICSYNFTTTQMAITFSTKNRISDANKEAIAEVFKYKKTKVTTQGLPTPISYIEEIINKLVKTLSGYRLYTVVPDGYIEIVNKEVELPIDIKNLLIAFVLKCNEEE